MLAYVVGIALGDGNLSNPNGRATRLRVTCDAKYPRLARRIARCLRMLLPNNRVAFVPKERNCLDVSCYSTHWEEILGWQVGRGSKIAQSVSIPTWIKQERAYAIPCLRGLFETDGSIYMDRGYPMAMFVNACEGLANDVADAMTTLGFRPRMYKIDQNRRCTVYHVRLSRDVPEFMALVRPMKS